MNSLDIYVQKYFSLIRTPFITEYMYLLSTTFDVSISTILICLCVAILIYIIRNKKYAYLFVSAMLFQAIVVFFLKMFFDISRPLEGVMNVFGKSFPSYHATSATVFFVMLMYIFDSHLKIFGRISFNIFCVSMILLVSFSRIYLGVHWLSDVLGGIFLGVFISYLSVIVFKKIK